MKLFIKNMVCHRCIAAVTEAFRHMHLDPKAVELGEVELEESPDEDTLNHLRHNLAAIGFEILDNQKQRTIETIKAFIIAKVQSPEIEDSFNLSTALSRHLTRDYSQLSRLFSEVEGKTIEQFFILQKTERVKELLKYAELSLGEIAWKLGYSSISHLSAQFKKVTGMTPSDFKKMGGHRHSLDRI